MHKNWKWHPWSEARYWHKMYDQTCDDLMRAEIRCTELKESLQLLSATRLAEENARLRQALASLGHSLALEAAGDAIKEQIEKK